VVVVTPPRGSVAVVWRFSASKANVDVSPLASMVLMTLLAAS
jgi:hypothetical protein